MKTNPNKPKLVTPLFFPAKLPSQSTLLLTSLTLTWLWTGVAFAEPQAANEKSNQIVVEADTGTTSTQKEAALLGEWPDPTPAITVSVQDKTLAEAISLIAARAGWGLTLTAPDDLLEHKITLNVKNKPAKLVLDVALSGTGLVARLTDGLLVVKPDQQPRQAIDAAIDLPGGDIRFKVKSSHNWRRHFKDKRHSDERTAIGGDLRINAGETVAGDAVAVGGSVTVAGKVEGDAVAVGGSVTLEPTAVVEGDATAIGGEVIAADGAVVEGDRVSLAPSFKGAIKSIVNFGTKESLFSSSIFSALATLLRALALFVLGLLLLTFMPERLDRIRNFMIQKPAATFIGGFAILIGIIPVCILLAVTLIGIPLIPVVFLLLLATTIVGLSTMCIWLGEKVPILAGRKNRVWALLIGVILLALIDLIPWVGTPAVFILAFVSAGAVALSRFGRQNGLVAPDVSA